MFAKPSLGSTGRVQAVTTGTPIASIGGQGYVLDTALVSSDAVDSADAFIAGFRFTTDGAIRIYDATLGLPAATNVNKGYVMSDDGQLCVTTAANVLTYVNNGIAQDEEGRVYMDIS